ncbi:MAG: EAL domain-containing protein, partial [Oscillospiraceae bacterium]|nr:EAL domain-containing protein [Oscillospiraceae bacterium]
MVKLPVKPDKAENEPQSLLLQMLLSPYDALTEIDLNKRRIRAIRTAKDKYFAPVAAGEIKDMLSYTLENMVHPDDREVFIAANNMDTLLDRLNNKETPGVSRARYRYKLLDGGWCWVERVCVGGECFGLPHGIAYAFVFDIQSSVSSALQASQSSVSRRSVLTGLLRKKDFFAKAGEMMREEPGDWSVIAFDLEQFKLFNEWYGRDRGDMLLAKIGACLLRAEEKGDALAGYFGQDDFVLLVHYDPRIAEAIFEEVHGLIRDQGTSVGFMPAVGVSRADGEATIEELYDRAAIASRHAKENFHTRIRMFEPSMFEQTDQDYRILSDFQNAISSHELSIVLQPQCRIDDGKIVGAETLVRWHKADGTMVSPGVFVPVLERYGFVSDLDRYVWEEAFRWVKSWVDRGHEPLPVSVNVSRIDIYTLDVPEYFDTLRKRYDLSADAVKIEVTESAYVDNTKVAGAIHRLRENGFTVLMDDFGSGYSSLNMLRSLNVDVIKLDAKFLRMDDADSKGMHIMESIVNMAKTMSVPIIVEGVENRKETEFLTGLGCRYVQGYYFYRPLSVDDFEELIEDRERVDTGGFRFKESEQFQMREFLDQNVFSDSMLNNILGPAAFFVRNGKRIDVVRLNRQFCSELGIPDVSGAIDSFQGMVAQDDLPVLYGLLDMAAQDPLGGSSGELGLIRPDGTEIKLQLRFYFLDECESSKRYYGSVTNITQLTKLNEYMELLTRVSPDTLAFAARVEDGWRFRVAVHGLEQTLGIDRAEMERELNSGDFLKRIDPEDRERLRSIVSGPGMTVGTSSAPFT